MIRIKVIVVTIICFCLLSLDGSAKSLSAQDLDKAEQTYNQWLKDKFAKQHDELIPIVAVADMFYGCNQARQFEQKRYSIKDLIIKMDKDLLAEKLANCLAGEKVNSDTALNFGLIGCFTEQLKSLPVEEQNQKMQLVKKAITSLTFQERQKSFTQCVTDQAIGYLK